MEARRDERTDALAGWRYVLPRVIISPLIIDVRVHADTRGLRGRVWFWGCQRWDTTIPTRSLRGD